MQTLKPKLCMTITGIIALSWLCGYVEAVEKSQCGVSVKIAEQGRSLFPVVVGKNVSDEVRKQAGELAAYLGKITGAEFNVKTDEDAKGIAVGMPTDFASKPFNSELAVKDIADREAYILCSHKSGLYVLGATELAVEHAVWDLLYRIGYRQFFPGENWEVIPKIENLSISVHAEEKPDYYMRWIWYGWAGFYGGPDWASSQKYYERWCSRNRGHFGFLLNTGHAYDEIIDKNKAVFDAHPEYYGLVNDKRSSTKICIGNPELQKLVIDYALEYFKEHPDSDSISMEPSDGPGGWPDYKWGWCECEKCKAIGSISDRVVTLANAVAEAVNKKYSNKYVGMYAYHMHSPPPSVRVHPKVVISVATSFIAGGYTTEELIKGWEKQGAKIGIREYYSYNPWQPDLPGRSQCSNLEYLKRTIPSFYRLGSRYISAESQDNWAAAGLGYYIASRLMWDIDEAQRVDALVDDFLTKAFEQAKEPMTKFYRLLDGANPALMSDDLIGRMYRLLNEAGEKATLPQTKARINDLIIYTRYVELFNVYTNASGIERQMAFETFLRHAYRMRATAMVSAKALWMSLDDLDNNVAIPSYAQADISPDKNPWKSTAVFTDEEIREYMKNGIEIYKPAEYEPVAFSMDLVPASKLNLSQVPVGNTGPYGRNLQTFYTWSNSENNILELKVTGGLIEHYRDRGNAKVDLYHIKGEFEGLEDHGETAPDGIERTIKLKMPYTGLYKIKVSDGEDATKVAWPDGQSMTIVSSLGKPATLYGQWSLYFYVPKETKIVAVYADGPGSVLNAIGEEVFSFDGKPPGYFAIPVDSGQDGVLWKFHNSSGKRILLTVPPCLARNGKELLLPKEIFDRDIK
ncbi:MAG: DUF4838 domain-containing protein [Planctomycetota bacterium]